MDHELRWFFRGSVPDEVLRWAEERLGNPKVGSRTDYYFVVPEADYIGLKGRGQEGDKESKIETKWRTRGQVPVEILPNVSGVLEDWLKLSWKAQTDPPKRLPPDQDIANEIDKAPDGPWLAVAKERRQWKIELTDSSEWCPATGRADRGMKLEITRLSVKGSTWWTLGFDVFPGEGDDVADFVKDGASWLLEDYDGPPLTSGSSYGYPRFASLAAQGDA